MCQANVKERSVLIQTVDTNRSGKKVTREQNAFDSLVRLRPDAVIIAVPKNPPGD